MIDFTPSAAFLPEMTLVLGIFLAILAEITHFGEKTRLMFPIGLLVLISAFVFLVQYRSGQPYSFFGHAYVMDGLAFGMGCLALGTGVLSVSTYFLAPTDLRTREAEHVTLLLGQVLFAVVVASSNDLVLSALSLAASNFITVFFLSFSNQFRKKVSVLGAFKAFNAWLFSFVFLMLACLLFFAKTGTTEFGKIRLYLEAQGSGTLWPWVAGSFFLVGVFCQIALAPMSGWMNQTIESIPLGARGIVFSFPRISGIALLLRFWLVPFSANRTPAWAQGWEFALVCFGALSIVLGAVRVFTEKRVALLFSHLCLVQVGVFLSLVGIFRNDPDRLSWVLMGLFLHIASGLLVLHIQAAGVGQRGEESLIERPEDLARLGSLGLGVLYLVGLLGLSAMPPLPTFLVGLELFSGLLEKGYTFFAALWFLAFLVVGISIFRWVWVSLSHFRSGDGEMFSGGSGRTVLSQRISLILFLLPLLMGVIFVQYLFNFSKQALHVIFW